MFSYNQLLESAVAYDEGDPLHEAELMKLWVKLEPNVIPPKELKDPKWKTYGFQVHYLQSSYSREIQGAISEEQE